MALAGALKVKGRERVSEKGASKVLVERERKRGF